MSHIIRPQIDRDTCTRWIVIYAMCCTFCAMILLEHTPVHAQNSATTVDQAYLPIQPQELKIELLKASYDSVNLYNLVRRADHQNLADVAYDTLNDLRHQQPRNAVVLAAYCFAYQVAAGDYDNPGRKNHPFTSSDFEHYSSELRRAYQLDPKSVYKKPITTP